MFPTKKTLLAVFVSASFVTSGFLLMGVGVGDYMQAQITGQGSIASESTSDALHAAAEEVDMATTLGQFVLGLLLIVIGFSLHAFYVTHQSRSVRVHAVKHGKRKRKAKKMFVWFTVRV